MEQAMSYEDLTNQYFLNPDPAFSDQRNEMTELNQQESHELPFYLMRMCPRKLKKYFLPNLEFFMKLKNL